MRHGCANPRHCVSSLKLSYCSNIAILPLPLHSRLKRRRADQPRQNELFLKMRAKGFSFRSFSHPDAGKPRAERTNHSRISTEQKPYAPGQQTTACATRHGRTLYPPGRSSHGRTTRRNTDMWPKRNRIRLASIARASRTGVQRIAGRTHQ